MKPVIRYIGAYYRALWALARAWWMLVRPQPQVRPFLGAAACVETVGFIYLTTAAQFPGPHDVNWAQGRWIATDLGSGSPMRLVRLARDGSLVYKQQGSVVRVVVLAPGSVIPVRFDSRALLAMAAVNHRVMR